MLKESEEEQNSRSSEWIDYQYQSEKSGDTIKVSRTKDGRITLINADFREFI
jgi:hypothetical protein